VCVVGMLDVGCWFLTVGRLLLGGLVVWFWVFLDWDWIGWLKCWVRSPEMVDYWFEKVRCV
jgi:hypothetical protein